MVAADNNRVGDWFQTYTGKKFWPADVRVEDIEIEDIAHALSLSCRYTGHCNEFYSVAEHAVYVSRLVPTEFAFEGLMHDASEAYFTDVPKPLKRMLPDYKALEKACEEVIAKRYNLPFPMSPEVKAVDERILVDEYNALMLKTHRWRHHEDGVDGYGIRIHCVRPERAKRMFMERFEELVRNR